VTTETPESTTASQPEPPPRRPARSLVRTALHAVAVLIPLLLLGLLAFGVAAQSPSTTIDDSLARGHSILAADFRLDVLQKGNLEPRLSPALAAPLSSGRLSLRELRGVPVVLNFWASWCVPCAQEAPALERAWRAQARPRGVLFLGLDMQDAAPDGRNFMHHFGIDYPNIRDPGNDVALNYGVTGLPETFFISRAGKIVGHVIGESSSSQLIQGITAALRGQVASPGRGGAQRPTR